MTRTRSRSSGERCAARIVAALFMTTILTATGSSAALGQAQTRARASRGDGGSSKQAVALDGIWIHGVKDVDVVQMGAPGGGVNAQVTLTLFMPPDVSVAKWIGATMAGTVRPPSVQIGTFDYDMQLQNAISLTGARIQEIQIPEADAASKDAIHTTVRLYPAPAQQGMTTRSGQEPNFSLPMGSAAVASNFRLNIDGVDCSRVSKVAPLTITFAPSGGVERATALNREPRMTYSPLVVTVSRAYAAPFQQWLASGGAKNGTLTFLKSDLSTPLFVIRFTGLHVQSIANDMTANSQSIPRSKITLSFTGLSIDQPMVRSVVAP